MQTAPTNVRVNVAALDENHPARGSVSVFVVNVEHAVSERAPAPLRSFHDATNLLQPPGNTYRVRDVI